LCRDSIAEICSWGRARRLDCREKFEKMVVAKTQSGRTAMRKLLRLTILVGLMVLFGAAEDGMVFGIGPAQARIGRPLTPMSYAGVARRTTRRAYRRGYYGGYYHY
jgi:hypothetical protein